MPYYPPASGGSGTVTSNSSPKGTLTIASPTTTPTYDVTQAKEDPGGFIKNLSLTATAASSALTIAIKTDAGTDASSTDEIPITFRSPTAATGSLVHRSLQASLSLVISSGSLMGMVDGRGRLWVVIFDDGGTLRLGAVNCVMLGSAIGRCSVYALRETVLASSTAEGGAGAADSAGVIYTGTAVSAKAFRIVGYIDTNNTTAGTWIAPTGIQLLGPGVPLPGMPVQVFVPGTKTTTVAVTVTWPLDDTQPLQSETTSCITLSAALSNACNLIDLSTAIGGGATAAQSVFCGMYFGSNDTPLDSGFIGVNAANNFATPTAMKALYFPASTSSITYDGRCAVQTGTFTAFGVSGTHYAGITGKFFGTEVMG